MSDSQKAVASAINRLSEQLKCSVCLDDYQEPKVLSCLHVFCKTDLDNLATFSNSIKCPNCRVETRLPHGGVSGLKSAFYLHHLSEARENLRAINFAKIRCQKCEEKDANAYCHDCSKLVCESCIAIHRRWKDHESHELISLEQFQAEAIRRVCTKKTASGKKCSKHPDEMLKIYCDTCGELICRDCTVKVHHSHEYDLIGDCFPKHRGNISASLLVLKQQLDTVNKAIEEMDARHKRVDEQAQSTKQKILNEFDRLSHPSESRKRELITDVDRVAAQVKKTIKSQKELYQSTHSQISSRVEYVEESLRTGTPEEILTMKKEVVAQIEQMTGKLDPYNFQAPPEARLHFSSERTSQGVLGEVFTLHSPVCPDMSFAMGTGLQGTHQNIPVTLTLHTMNNKGQACTDTSAPVSGELVSSGGGCALKCEVTKRGDNAYELKYQPRTAGKYKLHIKVYSRHIKSSPFMVTVGRFQGIHEKTFAAQGLRSPRHMAITENGGIVVAEKDGGCVSMFDSTGRKIRFFGRTGPEAGILNKPRGISLCSDNTVLVAAEHSVTRFTDKGKFIASVGSKGGSELQFNEPWAIVFNPVNNKVYVCDTNNDRLQVLNTDLTYSSIIGCRGGGPGQFKSPYGIAVDSTGNIYVADRSNNRVQVFNPSDQFLREVKQRGPGKGYLRGPCSVCVDIHNFLYVLEADAARVSVFSSEGKFIKDFPQASGNQAGKLKEPWAIAVDESCYVYVSDCGTNRIQIFR